ncbi:MAG: SDR family NAD(P)-dependent oxidoreductase [Microthrixaceae bacterium]
MSLGQSLKNRRAVVTGASGDIGRAISHALADEGASLVLMSRSAEPLEALAKELRDKGGDAQVVVCDVTNSDDIDRAGAEVHDRLGTVDILVNNAGGARFIAPALETDESGWTKTIALNLTAPFLLSKTFGTKMVERGSGSIVNIGSISGLRHLPGMAAYSTAKGGLFQQTKALAREWGPSGVRVNAVAPGFVDTSGWDSFDKDEVVAQSGLPIALDRWATALEIALPVVFLASDAASYITGITLSVDGGMLA